MKKIVYLLIILLPLLLMGCNKEKNQIPEQFSFLIGKWKCIECGHNNTNSVVTIQANKLAIDMYSSRKVVFYYKGVTLRKYYQGLIGLRLNRDYDFPAIIFDTNNQNEISLVINDFKVENNIKLESLSKKYQLERIN